MITYKKIQMPVALKSGQIVGSNAATLETAYTAAWTTATLQGAEVPWTAFRDTILAVEKELAQIIASDKAHPYRDALYGRSSSLADNALIPTTDNTSKEFIGVFTGVVNAANDRMLTEVPVQTIDDLESDFFDDTDFLYYAITNNRLRHTVANAYFAGCVWDYTTQVAQYAVANTGTSPLPQALENTWIAGVLASLRQAGWAEGGELIGYGQDYQNGIQMLKARDLDMPIIPTNTATAQPSVN